MGDSTLVDGHTDKVLLSGLHALGDGGCHLVGLSKTPAYDTVPVTYYHDGSKRERAATLRHLRNAVDGHQAILQLYIVSGFYSVVSFCHDCFQNLSPPSRAASANDFTRPWKR